MTGDDKYAKLAEGAQKHLLSPQPAWGEPFPGLVGERINITTGEVVNNAVSWGGMHDSFYEYLIKMYVYDPERYAEYKER